MSLTISEGERLGIIGLNGAGKTTLLKLVAGIYSPTSGEVLVDGTVDCFLNPSIGTRKEATGEENIVTQLLYRGYPMDKIKALLPGIVDFSELGEFIRVPVEKYSSGMLARLHFSVVTSVEPDIMLLDEWLSAGDFSFVEKAKERMRGFVDRAHILLFASHNMSMIKSVCDRAIVVKKGRVACDASPDEAIAFYTGKKKEA
jgi:ABC-type polysaccharide/polyol phosphate transport system ATPase subunit